MRGATNTVPYADRLAPGIDPATQHAIEQFLYHEARLLDARDWEAWDALFTEDGMYWVPLVHGQTDPLNHASLFYENAIMRDVRRRRLEAARAWSQQPITRSARIVGNVVVTNGSIDSGELDVRSTFQMTEWARRHDQRQLAGHYLHRLVRIGDAWRMRLKRVDLINCDGVHDCFEIFI